MKLDRNTNPDGLGKYALANLRKYRALEGDEKEEAEKAIHTLNKLGVLSFGNESPGDQFFVMKYKDRFTSRGLMAYAEDAFAWAIAQKPMNEQIMEFAREIRAEANAAASITRYKGKLPD